MFMVLLSFSNLPLVAKDNQDRIKADNIVEITDMQSLFEKLLLKSLILMII